MLNINAKKLNLILVSITIAFVIIFSNCYVYAISDENQDKENDTNKDIESKISEDDEDIYSIESIVYNKVPLFDINVFSDTSAGVKISDNSIEGILKKTVAVWYVSLRNVTFIILAILIIYTGMRMAISTVAEEKATYKKNLIGWLKGIIVVVVIHYIIYIVINLNQNIVNTIAQFSGKEAGIYNTIKTRAMDTRLSIGFTATLIYLTVIVMWLRFIWTYIKRKFTVEFLIILAPLVVAKYTYELSSGTKSKILSNWFQRFATAVFIQSIHALFYTIFVGTVLELSTENLVGFVLSLMVLNFMLSADKIFTNIFKFNFSGKDIDDLNRPFVPKEDLAGLFVTYSVVKRIVPNVVTTVSRTGYALGADISNVYNSEMDKLDKKNGKDNRAIIRNKLNAPKDAIDDWALNKLKIKDKDYKNPIKKAIRRTIILRKMSRGNVVDTKRFVKRTIKMKHKETKRRFTSNYKFIKDIALGGAETILAIPIGVNYGIETGLTTGVNALDHLTEASNLGSNKNIKKEKKYITQLDDVVKSVETVYEETNKVSEEVSRLSDDEKEDVKEKIKKYSKIGMDKYKISKVIKEHKEFTRKPILLDKDVDKIIKIVEEKLPENMPAKDKKDIRDNAINTIIGNNATGNNSYKLDNIIDGINSAIINYSFQNKTYIGESIEKLSSTNSKEEAKSNNFGKLIDIDIFADTL